MGTRARGDRPLQTVELFKATKVKNDLGKYIDTMVSIGEFGATIKEFSGSRFAYFQTLGYSRPIEVRMYRQEFDGVQYNGQKVEVKSINEDSANRLKIIVLGDLVNGKY